MFYGIEQSTDMRNKRTVIKRFPTKARLLTWMQNSGGFTHSDPAAARNYHHTFRYGCELAERIDKKHRVFRDRGSPSYPRTHADNMASYLYTYGTEIDRGDEA